MIRNVVYNFSNWRSLGYEKSFDVLLGEGIALRSGNLGEVFYSRKNEMLCLWLSYTLLWLG